MGEFKIHGMDCAEEVATLKGALRELVPEDQLGFDVLNGKMSVPESVPAARVLAAVAATGMRAEPWVQARKAEAGHTWSSRDALVVGSGLGTAAGFGLHVAMAGLTAAVGSEGAGLAEVVPWPARLAYGLQRMRLWAVVVAPATLGVMESLARSARGPPADGSKTLDA